MSKVVQFRRGTTVEHAAFTGAAGEVTVDTDKKVVVVHDGATAGGIPMARDDEKANKATSPTLGHIALLDAGGNPSDSGMFIGANNNAWDAGRNLKTLYGDAATFMAALRTGAPFDIRIGDYWPILLTGTYRDAGTYTCPAGTTLYVDTALTTEAGTAATALEAQWINDTYCKVSSSGDKYVPTSACLAYYERTLNNAAIKLEVAAINPYWCYGDSGELTGNKPHVLFVSRDCLPHYLRFRKANTAWHMAPDPENGIGVWQGSALFATLNDPDYGILPLVAATDIGAYIYNGPQNLGMRYYGETRATEATTSSSGAWLNRGKLFLPTEDEVWGREIFTIRSYQGHLHLPLFHGSRRHISKGIGDGGSRNTWWEMSAYAGSASLICYVSNNGYPNNGYAVYGLGSVVCFLAI